MKKDLEILIKFGKKLRAKRRASEITLSKISNKSGIRVSTLSNWEKGKVSQPRGDIIQRLERAYDISFDEFRLAEGETGSRTQPLGAIQGSEENLEPPEGDVWRDIAKLHEAIRTLEARVAELEKENIKRERNQAG